MSSGVRTSTRHKSSPLHDGQEGRRDSLPTKRPVSLIEEQVLRIKDTQNAIERILKDMEKYSGSEFDKREEGLQALLNKSQELLVMLQVMMKIRNELAYARLDLEKAIKADCGIVIAKKRVKWLQQRLDRLVSSTRSFYTLHLNTSPKFFEMSEVSEELWSFLSKEQQDRYFNKHDSFLGYTEDSANIINDFAKMVLQPAPYNCLVKESRSVTPSTADQRDETEHARETEEIERLPDSTKPTDSKKKRKKKKSESAPDGSPSQKVYMALPDGDLYEGEGDSTPEPLSDSDLDDGHATESIVSSIRPLHEFKAKVPQEYLDPSPQSAIHGESQALSAPKDTRGEHHEKDDEYWDMEHHKFEWSDYMMNLDSRSWHALGIAIQDSFVSKEKHKFDANLPWKEKPLKVNSVIDVHKIALDKLLLRLHRMYESISQATQATIDPLPKDKAVETVMGKQQEIATPIETRLDTVSAESKKHDVTLPPLPDTTQNAPLSHQQSTTKYVRKKADKFFPRPSKEWCDDMKSGHDMPRLVTAKPTPLLKKTSNVQSRYLGRKPEVKVEKPFSLFRKDEWKPTAVVRLVGAMKVFDSSEKPRDMIKVEEGTPRWRRLMELLGESGLRSSNQTIAMEAAKTVGQLNCRHPDVLEALCKTISDPSKNARVCYEASKALILLGTWSPQAIKVIIEHIKKGNDFVVKEVLYTMTKAKNIPFVDKTTPEFRSLEFLLIQLVKVDYHPLSFRAAISLGRLCVVEPVSKKYLSNNLAGLPADEKSEALVVLIKQMNCKDEDILEVLLDHLCTAHNWKHRLEAADLLIFIGARDLFRILNEDKLFNVLERLLWDHANKELRFKIAEVINILGLRQAACSQVLG